MTTKQECRITSEDTGISAIIKMSEGNPGAIACLCSVMKSGPTIDPDDILGPWGPILILDSVGIYGSRIYILWNDICHNDDRVFVMLLRAHQLGFLEREKLIALTHENPYGRPTDVDINALDAQVCDRLPGFQKPTTKESI